LVLDVAVVLVSASNIWLIVIIFKLTSALPLVLAIHNWCILVHLRLALSFRFSTFITWVAYARMSATWAVMKEIEKFVSGRLPRDIKLLFVNNLITVHDLFYDFLGFLLVHFGDFPYAHIVCLHEVFKLRLKIRELFGQFFVLNS